MSTLNKILIFLGLTLLLAAGVFLAVRLAEIKQRQEMIRDQIVEQKQLADNILRAQSQYASKQDIETFAKNHSLEINQVKKDLSDFNANLHSINSAIIANKGFRADNLPSDNTVPRIDPTNPPVPCVDGKCPELNYGYGQNQQKLNLSEKFQDKSVPFGSVGFSAWKQNPWDIQVYPRAYKLTTVVGKDSSGKEYAYNKFIIRSNDQEYPVEIQESKFLQEVPESHFSFWNPRLYLGMGLGANISVPTAEAAPLLMINIMSYGRYRDQPDITVLGLGIGYGLNEKRASAILIPVQYNVGQHILFMKNLYIGAGLGVDTASSVQLFGTISAGL